MTVNIIAQIGLVLTLFVISAYFSIHPVTDPVVVAIRQLMAIVLVTGSAIVFAIAGMICRK